MNNDFINNNNYIKNHKSSKNMINNSLNNNYFVNSNEESQNKNLNCNLGNIKKNKLIMKRLNSFNQEIKKKDYLFEIDNQKRKKDNNKKILERINSEKIKSYMSDNKITGNKIHKNGAQYYNYKYNIERNGLRDYNSVIKDNYFNSSKNSLIHYKNKDLYYSNTKEENYYKNNQINNKKYKENSKQIFNNGGNLSNENINKENVNINSNLKKINDINNDKTLLSVKESNKNNINGKNISHKMFKNSSYINSNYRKEKFSNNLPANNNKYNKVKENNLYKIDCNIEYGKNLNFKYELINSNGKSEYNERNIIRFNSDKQP
jgi:hypothetical protein